MALNIRNREAERLAKQLSKLTGETKTAAVIQALRDRLARLRRERSERRLADELDQIAQHCAALPLKEVPIKFYLRRHHKEQSAISTQQSAGNEKLTADR